MMGVPKCDGMLMDPICMPVECVRVNQSIHMVIQIFCKLLRTNIDLTYRGLLLVLEDILKLLLEEYFFQLGSNPAYFINTCEEITELSAAISTDLLLDTITLIMFKFLNGQDSNKKTSAWFCEKLVPLLNRLASNTNQVLSDGLAEFLLVRNNAEDFEAELVDWKKHNEISILSPAMSELKPCTSGLYCLLVRCMKDHPDLSSIWILTFRIFATKYSAKDPRTFLFNFFTFLYINVPQSIKDVTAILAESKSYQHRNDDTYNYQTSVLRRILETWISSSHDWDLLMYLMQINYFLVEEYFGKILNMNCSEAFLLEALRMSINARKLVSFLDFLLTLEVPLNWIWSARNLFSNIPKPVVREVVQLLSSSKATEPVLQLVAVISGASPFTTEFKPLLDHVIETGCFEKGKLFIISVLNRSPKMKVTFGGTRTNVWLIDALLYPEQLSITKNSNLSDIVRLLPCINDPNLFQRTVSFILEEAITKPEYIQLFHLSKFYECLAVRHALLPMIIQHWDKVKHIAYILTLIPSELFASQKKETLELISLIASSKLEGRDRIIASLSEIDCMLIDLDIIKAMLDESSDCTALIKLIQNGIGHHGYEQMLKLTYPYIFVLKPLFSLSTMERHCCDHLFLQDFIGSTLIDHHFEVEEDYECLESMAIVAYKLKLTKALDQIEAKIADLPLNKFTLGARIRMRDEVVDMSFLASTLFLDSTGADCCDLGSLIFERMSVAVFKEALKCMLSLSNAYYPIVVSCVMRALNVDDRTKAQLAFKAGVWILRNDTYGRHRVKLGHRLVISKSVKQLDSSDLNIILILCKTYHDSIVFKILSVLQASYWHLVRKALPSYIAVLLGILEDAVRTRDTQMMGLLGRLITDLPGTGGISFAIPPLILRFIQASIQAPEVCQPLRTSLLTLFKHLDNKKEGQKASVDHISRLGRLCEGSADERVLLKSLLEEYRQRHKYTGKA